VFAFLYPGVLLLVPFRLSGWQVRSKPVFQYCSSVRILVAAFLLGWI